MAEKSGAAEVLRLRLELMMADAVAAAEGVTDNKALSQIESRFRLIASGLRACNIMAAGAAKEDNMSANDPNGDEARMARTDELRAEIERRLTRLRAAAENKSVAAEAEPRED